MAITFVTDGAWGTGTGSPLPAATVDENFYDVDQRLVAVNVSLADGKLITSVTSDDTSMTFTFSDSSQEVIPLPIATLTNTGQWTNSTPYTRGQLFTVPGFGIFQVLIDHTTPALPAVFDPNATDGSTDNNPLYSFFLAVADSIFDAAMFVPGSIQGATGDLLYQAIANRSMSIAAGDANAYAYLDIGNDATDAVDTIISIQKNDTEIGTITFTANGSNSAGGQEGGISIPAAIDFVGGDRYALRVTTSDNVDSSGLSVTLPFTRN